MFVFGHCLGQFKIATLSAELSNILACNLELFTDLLTPKSLTRERLHIQRAIELESAQKTDKYKEREKGKMKPV